MTDGIALSVLKSQVGTPAYILSPSALQDVDIAVPFCTRNRAH